MIIMQVFVVCLSPLPRDAEFPQIYKGDPLKERGRPKPSSTTYINPYSEAPTTTDLGEIYTLFSYYSSNIAGGKSITSSQYTGTNDGFNTATSAQGGTDATITSTKIWSTSTNMLCSNFERTSEANGWWVLAPNQPTPGRGQVGSGSIWAEDLNPFGYPSHQNAMYDYVYQNGKTYRELNAFEKMASDFRPEEDSKCGRIATDFSQLITLNDQTQIDRLIRLNNGPNIYKSERGDLPNWGTQINGVLMKVASSTQDFTSFVLVHPTYTIMDGVGDTNIGFLITLKYSCPAGNTEIDRNSINLNLKFTSRIDCSYKLDGTEYYDNDYRIYEYTDLTGTKIQTTTDNFVHNNYETEMNWQDLDFFAGNNAGIRQNMKFGSEENTIVLEVRGNEPDIWRLPWANPYLAVDSYSFSYRYVSGFSASAEMSLNMPFVDALPSNFPSDSHYKVFNNKIEFSADGIGTYNTLFLKNTQRGWVQISPTMTMTTGLYEYILSDKSYINANNEVNIKMSWTYTPSQDDAIVKIDLLKSTADAETKMYCPSFYMIYDNDVDYVYWRVLTKTRTFYNVNPTYSEIAFPNNYHFIKGYLEGSNTEITADKIEYTNPPPYVPPSAPGSFGSWDLEFIEAPSYVGRLFKFKQNVGDSYLLFRSENVLNGVEYFSECDGVIYKSDVYQRNTPLTLNLTYKEGLVAMPQYTDLSEYDYLYDDYALSIDDLDIFNRDYYYEDLVAELEAEVNRPLTDTEYANLLTWDMTNYGHYDNLLKEYSSVDDYMDEMEYSDYDLNTVYWTDAEWTELIYLALHLGVNNQFIANLNSPSSGAVRSVASSITQIGSNFELIIPNAQTDIFFTYDDVEANIYFKDKELPRQVGFHKETELFTTSESRFVKGEMGFDEDYIYYNGTLSGDLDPISPRTGKVILSLYEERISPNSWTFFPEADLWTNINISQIKISSEIIQPNQITFGYQLSLKNKGLSAQSCWLRSRLIPIMGSTEGTTEYYCAETITLVDNLSPGDTQANTIQLMMQTYATMPKYYGAYYLQLEAFAYVGGLIPYTDCEMGALMGSYLLNDKAMIVSEKEGNIALQEIEDLTDITADHFFDIAYLKFPHQDVSRVLISFVDEKRITLPRSYDLAMGGGHFPIITDFVTPETEITEIEPMRFLAKVSDVDMGVDPLEHLTVQYKFSYFLNERYRGSVLDPDGNGLYETDWTDADMFENGFYGFEWAETEIAQQQAEGYYQVIPTSNWYSIEFRVSDRLLNRDYKEFVFSYNPYVKLTPQEGNWDLDQYGLSGLWTLKSFSNFSVPTANVDANSFVEGEIDIHGSILYVPNRFRIELPEEYKYAKNFHCSLRYNYQGSFGTRKEVSYASYEAEELSSEELSWNFPDHYTVSVINFEIPTPDANVIPQEPYQINEIMRYEYIIEWSTKYPFKNISLEYDTLLYNIESFQAFLDIEVAGAWNQTDEDEYQFSIEASLLSPSFRMVLPEINKGESFRFKVIINVLPSKPSDLTGWFLGLIPLFVVVILGIYFYAKSDEISWVGNLGKKLWFIIAGVGIASFFAVALLYNWLA
jgi:hypothetical protein